MWVDTSGISGAGRAIRAKVEDVTGEVNRKVASRAARALNELRNAELGVLRDQRSGKKYISPFASRYDKNGKRRKKLTMYTASAPGEPPARRTGALRLHWNGTVSASQHGNGMAVTASFESQERYSVYLEQGTRRMAARPFHDRIVAKALPAVVKIYSGSYV